MNQAPIEVETDGIHGLSEICDVDYGELKWVIPDILPLEGVTMLVGSPKAGKSLFILNVIINYLLKDVVLGYYPPMNKPLKVLYLDLEGSPRRVKARISPMIGGRTLPVGLVIANAWPRFGDGGLRKLQHRMELEHFDLIIIDTLGKLQSVRSISNAHSYSMDEQEIDRFVRLCRDYSTSIILVHHTRKAKSDDWVDMVSGSHGISGTVDTLLYLFREKGQTGATLHVTGRDVEEERYRLAFEPTTNQWEMLGRVSDLISPLTDARREIIQLLSHRGVMMKPTAIATQLGKSVGSVKMLLGNMLKDDEVVRYGQGLYGTRFKI